MRQCIVFLIVMSQIVGCEQHVEREQRMAIDVVGLEKTDAVLAIVLDLSGSFYQEMVTEGRAYKLFGSAVENLFFERMGRNDLIIIGQISGNKQRSILFEGTPMQFGQRFPDAKALNDFLASQAEPSSSNVYGAVTDMVRRVHRKGAKQSAVLVLSDMEDNVGGSKEVLQSTLREYADAGGVLGMYCLRQQNADEWTHELDSYGFRGLIVQDESVVAPQLPVMNR